MYYITQHHLCELKIHIHKIRIKILPGHRYRKIHINYIERVPMALIWTDDGTLMKRRRGDCGDCILGTDVCKGLEISESWLHLGTCPHLSHAEMKPFLGGGGEVESMS